MKQEDYTLLAFLVDFDEEIDISLLLDTEIDLS